MPNSRGPRLLGVAAVLVALTPSAYAAAHPFGPPPEARVAAEGATVTVTWSAEADDLNALGYATGAFGERQVFTFDADGQPLDADVAPDQDRVLSGAPEIADYLGAHIRVHQSGSECPPTVIDTGDITEEGARLVFTCPEVITTVELTIDTLTDLHPAYRTVGVVADADDPSLLFTEAEPVQTVGFDAQAQPTSTTPWLLGLGAAVVVATGAAALIFARRTRRGPRDV